MKQKINELLLVAAADNQLMIVPVVKDSDGLTVAEVVAHGQGEAEISFQEELLKSGLAKTRLGEVECPNQIAFENAQRIAISLLKLECRVRANKICIKAKTRILINKIRFLSLLSLCLLL
ncbi:hypothetical protein LC613_33740 [Nostoc sphaeroides CHAB 2801]|uniref:hypothetical protein n=1 Tax=Nostoc sphaeroides TaxID=446679 RepID=UPI001E2B82AA|nr:hypothetical protein [Nostoc sphaeroides]MCC5632576.1 hypothetical protein [Nostoc sphaeroides CHAB 2801]